MDALYASVFTALLGDARGTRSLLRSAVCVSLLLLLITRATRAGPVSFYIYIPLVLYHSRYIYPSSPDLLPALGAADAGCERCRSGSCR